MTGRGFGAVILFLIAALFLHLVVLALTPFLVLLAGEARPPGLIAYPVIAAVTGGCAALVMWGGSRLSERWRLALGLILMGEAVVWLA